MAKAYRQARHRSENWARHCAITIVSSYGVICLEDLNLPNMTKSAKGTVQRPGKGVAQKKGLNRALQDAALGRLAYWICVNAEKLDAGYGRWTRRTPRANVPLVGIPRPPTGTAAASHVNAVAMPNTPM